MIRSDSGARSDAYETNDGADYKLQTWVEKTESRQRTNPTNSKLLAAFQASGRTREQFDHALANIRSLSDYEIDRKRHAWCRLTEVFRGFAVNVRANLSDIYDDYDARVAGRAAGFQTEGMTSGICRLVICGKRVKMSRR